MTDPITLTLVGTIVLTEGVKFLYGQAGELLKRWREHSDTKKTEMLDAIETPMIASPEIFEGELKHLVANVTEIRTLEPSLRELRGRLADYAQGIDKIDASDSTLISTVDALRQQLEAVYGQRITFKGERNRALSGTPFVAGEADIKKLAGLAGGVIAESVAAGEVQGKIKVGQVESGGISGGVIVDGVTGGRIYGEVKADEVNPGGIAAGVKIKSLE